MKLPKKGDFVRHHGTLIRIDIATPPPLPPPVKDFIFEEQEARCELRLNGKQLKELQTLNDFDGLGTAVKSAIEEMKRYTGTNNIGKDSDLEVVVVEVVSQFRAKPLSKENFYDKEYFDFERNHSYNRPELPVPVETVVWSSKGL